VPQQTVARIIDEHGGDDARADFEIRRRLSLEGIPCRPALVTLRLGRVAPAQVFVPEAPSWNQSCKDPASNRAPQGEGDA
jgi:hypothetical protein